MTETIETNPEFQNQFWLQIMGDHARFILTPLSPIETEETDRVKSFIQLFDGLLAQARQTLTDEQKNKLNQDAYKTVQDFRKYILHLIKRQITGNIRMNLNPAPLNMMVNYAELYLNILHSFKEGSIPAMYITTISSIWLHNIYIQALMIQQELGIVFFRERKQAFDFANLFLDLYSKSIILDGLRRTGENDFPALVEFTLQINETMREYAEYLVDLLNLIRTKKYIGMLNNLDVDDMYRKICYYMIQLSNVSEIRPPVCDPTSPRLPV